MFKQRYHWTFSLFITLFLSYPGVIQAKVDLVTLPDRDKAQVTIYNSADLTLVRESRTLTLKKGENRLEFSWANTLIDPTSLQLFPKAEADKVFIQELSYPPRVKDLGQWRISSSVSGQVPIEILYFTSGISWQAYYLATLSRDEKEMDLEGYVRVTNRSGEDYENAEVCLIVGKVHLLDEIAELARRFPPYGKPEEMAGPASVAVGATLGRTPILMMEGVAKAAGMKPKEIVKEGLSEYFLYTIEGTETIPDGWGKRLPSFQADKVPVLNTYRYEEERYGKGVVRFLTFKNDKDHRLGKEPLPDGLFKVFQQVNPTGELSYLGADQSKYIPIDQKAELNLGSVKDVSVEPTLTNYKTENYLFDNNGNITGWDEILTYKVKVVNYRPVPVSVEVKRNFPHQYWELTKEGEFGDYEKVDLDTVKFSLSLPANSSREFTYQVRLKVNPPGSPEFNLSYQTLSSGSPGRNLSYQTPSLSADYYFKVCTNSESIPDPNFKANPGVKKLEVKHIYDWHYFHVSANALDWKKFIDNFWTQSPGRYSAVIVDINEWNSIRTSSNLS